MGPGGPAGRTKVRSLEQPTSVRLRRFPLHLPLRYRYAGGFQWFTGVSENISCSGVLFRGRVRMDLFSPVEVRIPVPREITGDAAATMLCGGYIVRAADDGPAPNMAATFVEYRLQYQDGRKQTQLPPLELGPAHDEMTTEFFHELRNLLAIIMGNSELAMSHGGLDPDVQQCLLRVLEASERAAVLLHRMNGKRKEV